MKRNEKKELDSFKNTLRNYDRIILYGAGIWGELLLRRIYEWKLYKRVTFAVTGISTQTEYMGIEVVSIESLKECKDNYIIVVSVGEALTDELCNYLVLYGIKPYISLNTVLRSALKEGDVLLVPNKLKQEDAVRIEQFKNTLKQYDRIILYGAGIWGEILLQRIYEWKLYKKVCFAVTDTIGKTEHMGIEVVNIDSIRECKDNYIIVISVGEALTDELSNNLVKHKLERKIILDGDLRHALRVNTIKTQEIEAVREELNQKENNKETKNDSRDKDINRNRKIGDMQEINEKYLIYLLENQLGIKRLDAIELYFIEVKVKRDFSFGAWPARLHCCVRIVCGEHSGWGEICLPLYANSVIENVIDNVEKSFAFWKGTSIEKAKFLVKELRGCLPDRILEAIDMALVDLSARLQGKSALEYLDLTSDYAVPALSCVLKRDIDEATSVAKEMATTHLKIKLFGDNIHDYNLIKAVRQAIPKECYLVGDVNMGYASGKETQPYSADIEKALMNLHEAGLDACEDPANISWEDLERLQNAIPDMPMIPDELMRPAYKVIKTVKPVQGHIYNLHPNCMGSLTETVKLAQKLKAAGSDVMIGDSSLIGPACVAWQQVACGVKAAWCEALEKPMESTVFLDSVLSSPMEILEDGRRRIAKYALGFGLEVDEKKLAEKCIRVVKV